MRDIAPTDYDGLTEEIIRRLAKRDSCFVDVGAHSGEILGLMVSAAPDGYFFAFEPLPHLVAGLRAKFTGDKVEIHELALSDRKGITEFNHVVSNPGYSGIRKRRYDRPDEVDEKISVATDTLDNITTGHRIDLIKIDVEGAEFQVLSGAVATLSRDRPTIIFEHGLGGSDVYGTTPQMMYALLAEKLGAEIFLLHDFLANMTPLSAAGFCQMFESGSHYYFVAHWKDRGVV